MKKQTSMDRMGWSFFQRIRAIFFIFCTAAVRRHCSSTLASPRIRQYRAPCSSLDSAKLRSLVLFPSCSFARFVSQVGRYLIYLYPRLQKYFKFLPQLWPPYCFFWQFTLQQASRYGAILSLGGHLIPPILSMHYKDALKESEGCMTKSWDAYRASRMLY